MTFRSGTLATLAFTFALAGCGGAGAGAADGPAPQSYDPDDLPAWVQALPEGSPPVDNTHTQQASIYLLQAASAGSDEQRETRLRSALETAREGIAAAPENAQSYLQAGEALLGLREYEEGAAMLDRAESIYPRYVIETDPIREEIWIELYNEAVGSLEAGDSQGALRLFGSAHTVYQARPEAMIQAASLLSEMGRNDEAMDYFREAAGVVMTDRAAEVDAEMRASWVELRGIALFNLAQLLFQAERFDEAAAAYATVLEDDPENLMALSNMAIAYVSAGDVERARQIYERLLSQPNLTAREYYIIGVGLYQSEIFDEAARAFAASVELVPNHRDAVFNYTQSLFLQQDWEGLLAATERLLEVDTHNSFAFRYRAQALVNLERQQEAVQVLEVFQELPFELDMMQLAQIPDGVALVGQAFNLTQPVGTEVSIRIHFYTVTGELAGSADTTVRLGEVEEGIVFQADLQTTADVFGFRAEVL